MSSASRYTNRIRVLAEASVRKVQYPGKVAVVNALLPAINCKPSFEVLQYPLKPSCPCPSKPKPYVPDYFYYSGGHAYSTPSMAISGGVAGDFYYIGGDAFSNPFVGITGGYSGNLINFFGGNAFSNPTSSIYGGDAEVHADYSGGDAFTDVSKIIYGGQANNNFDYSGGDAFTDSRSGISGGEAGDPYYSGGNASSVSFDLMSGGDSGANDGFLRGGNAFAKPITVTMGGNSLGELYLGGGGASDGAKFGEVEKLRKFSGGDSGASYYVGGNAFTNSAYTISGGTAGVMDVDYSGGDANYGAKLGEVETRPRIAGGDAFTNFNPPQFGNLSGGDALTDSSIYFTGGGAKNGAEFGEVERLPKFSGSDAGNRFDYLGGDAFSNPATIISGGGSGVSELIMGGNAFTKATYVLVNGMYINPATGTNTVATQNFY